MILLGRCGYNNRPRYVDDWVAGLVLALNLVILDMFTEHIDADLNVDENIITIFWPLYYN